MDGHLNIVELDLFEALKNKKYILEYHDRKEELLITPDTVAYAMRLAQNNGRRLVSPFALFRLQELQKVFGIHLHDFKTGIQCPQCKNGILYCGFFDSGCGKECVCNWWHICSDFQCLYAVHGEIAYKYTGIINSDNKCPFCARYWR